MFPFSEEEKHALLLSTLAGLSTSIGGAIAVICYYTLLTYV